MTHEHSVPIAHGERAAHLVEADHRPVELAVSELRACPRRHDRHSERERASGQSVPALIVDRGIAWRSRATLRTPRTGAPYAGSIAGGVAQPLRRVRDQPGRGGDAELLLDARPMRLDRLGAEVQRARDL